MSFDGNDCGSQFEGVVTLHPQRNQNHAPRLQDMRVPAPLRDLPYWLVWRFEQFVGEDKPRKIPYWADGTRRHGTQGAPADLNRLTTFAEARDAAVRGGFAGVGFAPLSDCEYAFLDFDKCVDAEGRLHEDVEAIVARTYAEYSPSGTGVRAVLKGNLGNHKSQATAEQYGFETFSSNGFVTFTGNILPGCDLLGYEDHIAEVNQKTKDLCQRRFDISSSPSADPDDFMAGHEPRLGLSLEKMQEPLSHLDPGMGRDQWIRVGMALHHETGGDDTGFELWDEWSQGGHNYPGTEALRGQWDSFKPKPGKRLTTMASVIKMAKEAGYKERKTPTSDPVLAKADEVSQRLERGRFSVLSYGEVLARKPLEWLIKGVLPKADLAVIFGPSGSGKSFVALDLAMAIARGISWRGKRVRKGKVAIVAAEGGSGVQLRLKAYQQHHGLSAEDMNEIGIVLAAPNFLDQEDIGEVIGEIRKFGDVATVIIDTFAQVTPGANENTSEDMGRALANLKLLNRGLDTTAVIVHHAGKDPTKGSRGWSGLKAAADVQLEVVRKSDRDRYVKVEKMKDGEDGGEFWFELGVVDLGIDADGDPVSSCVVLEIEPAVTAKPKVAVPSGSTQKKILDTAIACGAAEHAGALVGEVIAKSVSLIAYDPNELDGEKPKRDQRRTNVTRALRTLCERGFLVADGDWIYLPEVAPLREG
jgi:KaiC/GvpD/RAD55 family RecA-like ATPase